MGQIVSIKNLATFLVAIKSMEDVLNREYHKAYAKQKFLEKVVAMRFKEQTASLQSYQCVD